MFNLNSILIVILFTCFSNLHVNCQSNENRIEVVRGGSFWMNCSFDFPNVQLPWTLTIKKLGPFPNDIYRIDSGSATGKISPWNQTGVEIIDSTRNSLLIDGANDRSFGEYDCELVDGQSITHMYRVQVIESAHSDSMSWFRVKSSQFYWIQLITLNFIVFCLFK
ncbi:uncharacterized protein LOC128391087 [Panonychus citri]|uniref:uncharacterized protein LOC128391087 n=1 Tax=Panonychus citri TaxID=50023 RepID=UPI002307EEFF|nr:uncharacterized protein LOC128391087 [Panonychus citri]